MFARVTQFKMKAGTRDAATALMHELKPRIMGLDGMHQFINVMNDDGSGYVVSIVKDEATSDANSPQVMALWQEFADMLEGVPTPAGFEVVAAWSN
ncbi:MAG: hypothetical protein AAGF74_12500 [Pseudomonadota bacterium]